MAAETPRTLWVELTSKCPLDCVFCSRKTRRGAGEHLPFELYQSLVRQVADARTFRLNYSGESTVYPELIPAIGLARATGASVELVTALVNVAESALAELCASGLHRLTVSLHTLDAARYREIYRYGTAEAAVGRLTRLVELCRAISAPPAVDLAFVAMDTNLQDLPAVAAFAQSLGLRDIHIFPVLRRDEIPVQFPAELTAAGAPKADFKARVRAAVERASSQSPAVALSVCNPAFTAAGAQLGEVPSPYPDLLPPGARIHSCEQNPWETTHVLANGDVVACEVLDQMPLGNLGRQSLAEIWHGEPYVAFRERYFRGQVPECRACPWKRAYLPAALASDILAARGRNAQLLYGWHEPVDGTHIWASRQAMAVLAPREGSRTLHVSGRLPPGPPGEPNELMIFCNRAEIGRVANPWEQIMPFGLDFPIAPGQSAPWYLEFRTRFVHRAPPDRRDLGFAMVLLASKAFVDPDQVDRAQRDLRLLPNLIEDIDAAGKVFARFPRRRNRAHPHGAGISVLIPERDNVAELSDCLAGLAQAAARVTEPLETIVVVNGSPAEAYASLRAQYPNIQWQFSRRPLGFSGAVRRGLERVRFDWVYLLNSDVVLDAEALNEAARHRDAGVFSIASQILLKDRTRFREETNWTALFLENGLVTIHDRIPQSDDTLEGFYAGGGASLFQTRLLRRFAKVSVYEPFYWEDVEWGWRARKLGYRSLFCPRSLAHHTQRATIDRQYRPAEIERVLERNRILFQLRNLTGAGALSQLCDALASSPGGLTGWFLRPSTLWKVACGRLWNQRAPVPDDEVLRS